MRQNTLFIGRGALVGKMVKGKKGKGKGAAKGGSLWSKPPLS